MNDGAPTPTEHLTVEIWSDVVCPWCYIGKRRFEAALRDFEHADAVDVVWRSFELDPDAPTHARVGLEQHLAEKYGVSLERAAAMNKQVTELAAAEGLDYRLDQAQRGNTFDAHRLLHLAQEHGLQKDAKERLLRAYFTEARAISDTDSLVELLDDVDVPADEVREVLSSDAHADDVRADETRARQLGITGVPFFALDGRYGLPGAQPADTILQALRRTWQERAPLQTLGESGAACDDDGCAA